MNLAVNPDIRIPDLREGLISRIRELLPTLLPGGKFRGKKYVVGGIDGGPGDSMDVELEGEKAGVWMDRATGEGGDLIRLWELVHGVDFKEAIRQIGDHIGMVPDQPPAARVIDLRNFKMSGNCEPPVARAPVNDDQPPAAAPAFDWQACLNAFTSEKAAELAAWRGYSPDFVRQLHAEGLIGLHRGNFALPVKDTAGNVIRCHYRFSDGKGWAYFPKGDDNTPLIVGDLTTAGRVLVTESQWDAFAILEAIGYHEGEGHAAAIITRGANSNTDFSGFDLPQIIAVPQNDPAEKKHKTTGRTPAEEWLERIRSTKKASTRLLVANTPPEHKDANDWIRAESPGRSAVNKLLDVARNPILATLRNFVDVMEVEIDDDPSSLIGHKGRFLGKGSAFVVIGPSGVGKSTLTTSLALHAAAGEPWHGITFRRPLKTLIVQAENDPGDLKEMMLGVAKAAKRYFGEAAKKSMVNNILFQEETERTGEEFCKWLEQMIIETGSELVFVDPLLSYVGDDISLQKVASQFLRNWLNPVLKRTGAILICVHHTGKPPTDAKARSGWAESDLSYSGLGSSEIVNWARAVAVIQPLAKHPGKFRFTISKRGIRAGMNWKYGADPYQSVTSIFLSHGKRGEGLAWDQCAEPEEEGGEIVDATTYLSALPDEFAYADGVKWIRQKFGTTSAEAKRGLAALAKMNRIQRVKDDRWRKM